jgi:hypothetical protein
MSLSDFDTFMKTRRLVILCALLGALVASGVSASADEHIGSGSNSLSNTTISGYVDTAVSGQFQQPAQLEHRSWWQSFLLRFGFHG